MTMLLLFISWLFGNIAKIGSPDMFYYGGFVFLSVYAYTELMDRSPYAIAWEAVKNIAGIIVIYQQGDWFGISQLNPFLNNIIIAYFILATLVTGWFVYLHWKEDQQVAINV